MQVRSALAASATFLTLISASATGRVVEAHAEKLQAAQFLLSLLFAGALAYYLTGIYHHTLAIADNGARRHEMEEAAEGEIATMEGWMYSKDARGWRQEVDWPSWLLAAIPRYGQSQRLAVLFAPVVALYPAAWFALVSDRSAAQDAAVIVLTGLLAVLVIRVLFAGCRHWLWVDPCDLTLKRKPVTVAAPAWGWWFYRLEARDTALRRRVIEARARWQGTEGVDLGVEQPDRSVDRQMED